ncbi:hypothetical protein NB705_002599 [Xanthomonas sacchari]|nr:hypothetical protein [Xanthomonas sacchari]
MPGGDALAGGAVDVVLRIVEEDVRAEGLQERPLVAAAEEQRLVQAHAPFAQGADHPLVRRRRACGDQRGTDRRGFAGRERGLQRVQRRQEIAERPAGQRLARVLALVAAERFHALLAREALALVAEDHRIAVEGDAQLGGQAIGIDRAGGRGRFLRVLAGRLGQDGRRGDAMAERAPHRLRVGRKEQIGAERLDVRPGRLTGGEGGTHDAQPIVLDRIEDAQPGVGGIARQQDHLHRRRLRRRALVQRQQLAHHRKRHPGRQHIVLALALIRAVRLHPLPLEQGMALFQIEQGARGDRDGEQTGGVVGHFGL